MSIAPMRLRFDFIEEKGGQRLKDRDATTQHIIRKRATQAAAATKKLEGRNGKVNVIQYPPWITPGESNASQRSEGELYRATPKKAQVRAEANDYSHRRKERPASADSEVDYSFRSTELSQQALSPLHYYIPSPALSADQLVSLLPSLRLQELLLSHSASSILSVRESNKTRKILRLTNSDFISLIVDRYGQNRALDAAVDCLAARTKQLIGGDSILLSSMSGSPDYLYGRALRYVKQDIDNVAVRLPQVTTKLAILTLALFELLNTADQIAWILHSNGAAILLQKAGPKLMDDELKRKLLTICTPILGTEALLSGRDCFLAQPEWQKVINDSILFTAKTFDDRGVLLISLRMLFVQIPSLFNEVTATVLDEMSSNVFDLRSKLQLLRMEFALWRRQWDRHLHNALSDLKAEDMRLYALTLSLVGSALVDRLLVSIQPEQPALEESATQLSRQAIEATERTTLPIRDAKIRVGFMVRIAESIVATTGDWNVALYEPAEQASIDRNVFSQWCRLLGRPV